MPTGYEVGMYRDIARLAKAMDRIALALEQLVQQGKDSRKTSSVEDDFSV